MRKGNRIFNYIILFIFCQVLGLWGGNLVLATSVDDFYFKDFTADYYLSRDEAGISHLKVVEELTAVFPDYNQNKGICRYIPFTNQNGANITLPDLNNKNISVRRNGMKEPIYSIEKEQDFYEVCTGDESYVLGEQVYTFEYEFEKVVTDFGEYQELYWDTNGNGWAQKFDRVTANLHFVGVVADDYQGLSWCYVGKYGESGQERCKITETFDGVSFTAENLKVGENLTFDAQFELGSFVVPEPEKNYSLVFALLVILAICFSASIYIIGKYLKNKDKEDYFKSLFVKPEYQPNPKCSLEELAELYMGKKKDVKVAVLLDLVVRKRIELISEGEKKWAFKVLDLNNTGKEERILLAILNGGKEPKVGDKVQIESRKPSVTLAELYRSFYATIRQGLISGEMVGDNYVIGETQHNSLKTALITNLICVWPFLTFIVFGIVTVVFVEEFFVGGYIVLKDEFLFLLGAIFLITILVWTIFSNKVNRFKNITKRGIEAEKYMEGLELYIRMTEKDRLNFLQSVDGADVSPKGVVKLYEKLLPYAAVFGLEKSWMKQMEEYCRVREVAEPDWVTTGITVAQISHFANTASSYAASSSTYVSGGGGFSSGFSGGGGGGFSGGGGGGGGGGGR